MNLFLQLKTKLPELEQKLGYVFQEKKLFLQAFVHSSFFNENRKQIEQHNERLEFLGDSVLGLIVAGYLYEKFPQLPEGDLSKSRSFLVDAKTCAEYIKILGMDTEVLLGKGERYGESQRGKETILADAFEAILGAIYLDGGFLATQKFFLDHFKDFLEKILEEPFCNYKAELQEYSQKVFQKTPTYRVLKEEGPEHVKYFSVEVRIEEKTVGVGEGPSKKQAQQAAAKDALSRLK